MAFPRSSVLFAVISICWAALAFRAARMNEPPVYIGDHFAVHRTASHSIFSLGFWAGERPPAEPFLLKLCRYDYPRVIKAQAALTVVSHLILAWTLFILSGRGLWGVLSGGVALVYGLAWPIIGWVRVMHSESISFSFMALLISTLAWFFAEAGRNPARRLRLALAALALASASLALSLCRDNWNYMNPFLATAALAPCALRAWRARQGRDRLVIRGALAASLFVIFIMGVCSQQIGRRWEYCLMNIIFSRALPHEEVRARWIADYGMPVDDLVMAHVESSAWAMGNIIYLHEEFYPWVRERGLRAYQTDLLNHPGEALGLVWRSLGQTHDDFGMESLAGAGAPGRVSNLATGFLFRFGSLPGFLIAFGMILIGPALMARAGRRPLALAALFMAAMAVAQTPIITLADSMAVGRHSLGVTLTLRLLFLVSGVMLLELAVKGSRLKPTREIGSGVEFRPESDLVVEEPIETGVR